MGMAYRGGKWTLVLLTCLTMAAFAANSLLARLALLTTPIDAASFTAIRLTSGALMLALIVGVQRQPLAFSATTWWSAVLLFTYAAAFSFAYRSIGTGAGALVLFASAQLMMIGYGWYRGERASVVGIALAGGGLAAFLMPSAAAPAPGAAAAMALAGCAWGGFSLLGRSGSAPPVATTTASFLLSVPLALALLWWRGAELVLDGTGALYALLSGTLASALGYAIWYWVRSRLTAISAGAVQLSVPLVSALLGVLVLGERLAARSVAAALVTLAGVGWVTWTAQSAKPRP